MVYTPLESQMTSIFTEPVEEQDNEIEKFEALALLREGDIPAHIENMTDRLDELDEEEKAIDPHNYIPEIFHGVDLEDEKDEPIITGEAGEDVLFGGAGDDDDVTVSPISQKKQKGYVRTQVHDPLKITITEPNYLDLQKYLPEGAKSDFDARGTWEQGLDWVSKVAEEVIDPSKIKSPYSIHTPVDVVRSLVYGLGKGVYDMAALAGYGVRYTPNALYGILHALPAGLYRGTDWVLEAMGKDLIDNVHSGHWAEWGQGQDSISGFTDELLTATHLDTVGRDVFDAMFSAWRVPPERQNAFTRTAQLTGEWGTIMGAIRKGTTLGLGLFAKEGFRKGLKHNLKSWLGGEVPKEVLEKTIDKSIKNVDRLMKGLKGQGKHTNRALRSEMRQLKRLQERLKDVYSPQMMTGKLLRRQGEFFDIFRKSKVFDTTMKFEKSTVLGRAATNYKPIAEMAVAASISQVMAENFLEGVGLPEYKKYAPAAGFLGALHGVVGLGVLAGGVLGVAKTSLDSFVTFKNLILSHYNKFTGNVDEQMRYHLKALQYSDEKILNMTEPVTINGVEVRLIKKEEYDKAVEMNPKVQNTMLAIGRAIENIPDPKMKEEFMTQIRHMYAPVDRKALGEYESMQSAYYGFTELKASYAKKEITKAAYLKQKKEFEKTFEGKISKDAYLKKRDKFETEFVKEAGLADQVNFMLRRDIEDGFIKADDLNGASDEMTVLIDQMLHSHTLVALREILMSKVSLGLHGTIDKMNMLNILDNVSKIMNTQTNVMEAALKGVLKKVSFTKDLGKAKGRFRKLFEHTKGRLGIIRDDSNELAFRLKEIHTNVKNPEVHTMNNNDLNDSIEDVFGPSFGDDAHAIKELRSTQGIPDDVIPPETAVSVLQAERLAAHGRALRAALNSVYGDMRGMTRRLYAQAYENNEVVEGSTLLHDLAIHLDEASAYTKLPPNVGDLNKLIRDARDQSTNFRIKYFRDEVGLNDEQILSQLLEDHREVRQILGSENVKQIDMKKLFDPDGNVRPDALKYMKTTLTNLPISREIAEVIPLWIPYKQLNEFKTTAHGLLAKAKDAGGPKVSALQEQTDIWTEAVEQAEKKALDGSSASTVLNRHIARNWYRNTIGATFQKWSFRNILADLRNHGVTQKSTKKPDFTLFDRFFEFKKDSTEVDIAAAAEQFKIAFSTKKDMNPTITVKNKKGKDEVIANPNFGKYAVDANGDFAGEIPEDIANLFLLSLRRKLEQVDPGYSAGLKAMSDTFVTEFLVKTKILNATQEAALGKVLRWRNEEIANAREMAGVGNDEFTKSMSTLTGLIKSLKDELKDASDKSVYSAMERYMADDKKLFDYLFGENSAAFDVVVKSEKEMKRALKDKEISKKEYDLWSAHRGRLTEGYSEELAILAKEQGTTIDNIIGRIGPRLSDDPIRATAQNPLFIIWNNLAGKPREAEFKEAIRSLFTKKLLEESFSFSKHKVFKITTAFRDRFKKNNNGKEPTEDEIIDGMTNGSWTLSREMDIVNFGKMIHDREATLDLIFKDAPQHLADIKTIFEIGAALKGTVLKSKILELPMNQSALSIATKFYNVARDFVSPRYVLFDLSFRQAQIFKAKMLQTVMTDPAAARQMVEFAQGGPKNAAKYLGFWKELALTAAIQSEEEMYDVVAEEDPYTSYHVPPDKELIGMLKSFFAINHMGNVQRGNIRHGKVKVHTPAANIGLTEEQESDIEATAPNTW